MAASEKVIQLFDSYAEALLARDRKAIAAMYAVPALILFPGRSIAIADAAQTEDFFASAWEQHEDVGDVDKLIAIMGEGPGTVWADVTWSYDAQPRERFCYQLIGGPDGYRIAVLTPLAVDAI